MGILSLANAFCCSLLSRRNTAPIGCRDFTCNCSSYKMLLSISLDAASEEEEAASLLFIGKEEASPPAAAVVSFPDPSKWGVAP